MQTLALIKPECVKNNLHPEILQKILNVGFRIVRMKMITMPHKMAEKFYIIHEEKIFFPKLIKNMTSGPIIALVLEKDNSDVIETWRKFIGNVNPKEAEPGTLRRMYGLSIGQNGLHGSDSLENAIREIKIIFP